MMENQVKPQSLTLNLRLWLPVLAALMLTLFLARFITVGWQRMLLNSNSALGDQNAYLQLGLDLREYGVLTDGTRNPLYPILLAIFARREWHYFTYAKLLSLAFGLIGILAIYYIGYRLFDLPTALLSAFLLSINMEFVLHSTFVLAESMLVLCILCAWFVMVRALREPGSGLLWGMAGVLVGLAYLAKGTGQLLVGCFILAAFLLHGVRVIKRRTFWAFLGAYSAVALILWIFNWRAFGNPTFNIAITHQMWMDKWEQNFVSDTSTLPTVWSYWQNHSWQEAWSRAWKGLADMRFSVAKMLWPTRSLAFDHFLHSGWSGVALAAVLAVALVARRSMWAFFRCQREVVVLTALMSVAFYLLFAWYIAIVPIPIRFLLPLLPLWLLIVAVSLVGALRWVLNSRRLPVWSKIVVVASGALVLISVVGPWFVLSGLANGQAFQQNLFHADAAFNGDSEQPLLWVRSGHMNAPVGVMVGPGNYLPTWRHSDLLHFVKYPLDIKTPGDFDAFLSAEGVEYVIVDADMVDRGRRAAKYLLGVQGIDGDRVALGAWPSDWALGLAYPDVPCKWCVFRRMTDGFPTHTTSFVLGNAVRLVGYDVLADGFRPGGDVTVTLYWESLRPVETDYTVFTQLLGPDWQLHGQVDRQPVYGQWPTSRWQPGQRFIDKFVVRISETAPASEYLILVGLYDLTTGQRLPVVAGGEQLPDDVIILDRFTTEEGKEKE